MDDKKEIEEIKNRLDKLEKVRLSNLAQGLSVISTNTISSGDTDTDEVIEGLRNFCNTLKKNIQQQ